MRQFKKSSVAAFVVASVLLAVAACQDQQPVGVVNGPSFDGVSGLDEGGSHFRYATLSWAPTAVPNEIRFRLVAAFRRSAYASAIGRCFGPCVGGLPGVGDTILEAQGPTRFDFGDGSAVTPRLRFVVTAIDISGVSENANWVLGEALDPTATTLGILHTYTPPGPFTALLPACCRVGQTGFPTVNLNNRAGGSYPIQTVVDLSGNSSPTSSMVPIQIVPEGEFITFPVPAADPDGDLLSYRLATVAEAGTNPQGIGFLHPPNLSINSSTGLITWDNRTLDQVDVWTTQVIVEDGATKTPVDFLLRISGAVIGSLPTCTVNATSLVTATIGTAVSFTVDAADIDGNVTLNAGALPGGTTMTPTLPVTGMSPQSSTFDWTPAAGQAGTHIVQFTATDANAQQVTCSITIEVNIVGPDGGDIPVTDESGVVQGTINIPAGALPNNTVIIAEFTNDPTCANVDGADGLCLTITIPSGTVIEPGTFVTIGLCLADGSFPPPEFAIFRTDDGVTVVLQNVIVELTCPTNGASNLGATPLTRLARGLWQKITAPFRPRVLQATFGDFGPGGLTGSFSGFGNGPQLSVERAEVTTGEITINGTFDFDGGMFDPQNEDVTITFGECTDPPTCTTNVQFVAFGVDFVPTDENDGWVFRLENGGERRVVISDDEAYDISIEGTDVDGIDLSFVSFIMQIGTRLQGVGLEFNGDGECIRANGTGGCQPKPKKEKRRK